MMDSKLISELKVDEFKRLVHVPHCHAGELRRTLLPFDRFAHWSKSERGLSNSACIGTEPQQIERGQLADRIHMVRCQFTQWNQYESPIRNFSMRDPKRCGLQDCIIIIEDINIDFPGTPPLSVRSTERSLEILELSQQLPGCKRCFDLDDGIQKIGLIFFADGFGLIHRGGLQHLCLFKISNSRKRRLQKSQTVTFVRPQSQIHCCQQYPSYQMAGIFPGSHNGAPEITYAIR